MILRELIQRIQSLYSSGVQSYQSRLTPRHIYNKLLTVRNRLIVQQINKKQRTSDWNYQTLHCVEMEVVPVEHCPCIPPSGCEILKSKKRLPKPLMGFTQHMIKSVNSITGSDIYSEVTLNEKKYKKGNKYTANKPDYFILDGYLYITHLKGTPRIISITGLFDDPVEAKNFEGKCSNNEDCIECNECISALDIEFPCESDLIEPLIELSSLELIDRFRDNNRRQQVPNSKEQAEQQEENQ